MNFIKNYVSTFSFIFQTLLFLVFSSPVFASSIVSGGAMTLNIDSTALEAAFSYDYSERPSFYVEEYFDAAQAASRTYSQLKSDHIVPGTGGISSTGLVFAVNGTTASGFNKANDFSFNANDLTATAEGAIGLGGAIRYRIDKSFSIHPDTGEEISNRALNGYMTLEYDASRAGSTGYSGWVLYNHYDYRADIFDLVNVSTILTDNSLALTGDLALSSAFFHMGGTTGSIVGDFSFQTTVVPVPAAVWLFASGLAGLFVNQRKQKALAV